MAAAIGATALTMGAAAPAIPAAAGAAGAAGAGAGAGAGLGASAGLIGGMTASEAALAGGGAAAGLGSGLGASAMPVGLAAGGGANLITLPGATAPTAVGSTGMTMPGWSFSSLMPSEETLRRTSMLGNIGSAVGQLAQPPPAPKLSMPTSSAGPVVPSTGRAASPTSNAAMQALLAQMQARRSPRFA